MLLLLKTFIILTNIDPIIERIIHCKEMVNKNNKHIQLL